MRLSAARSEAGGELPLDGTLIAITDYCAQQFAGAEADPQQMEAWLAHAAPPARNLPEVSREDLVATLACSKPSAPGPDGITYLAWSKVGARAEDVSWAVTQSMMAGDPVPDWVNPALIVFMPKGRDDSDDAERGTSIWLPVAARPIILRKCDTKTTAKCLDTTLRRVWEQVCAEDQRGFVRGRMGHDNVLSLRGGYGGVWRCLLCTMLLDQAQAFASVLHQ